ncbi:MAG: hypothetical protein KDA53_09110 [Hyphomonas sp.]|nr:hypothetical protein [Hyphomonas sp.]
MNYRSLLPLAVAGLLGLSACDAIRFPGKTPDEPEQAAPAEPEAAPVEAAAAPDYPVRPEALASRAAIDWDAALADIAAQPAGPDDDNFAIASTGEPPPVPVMLPSGIVIPQGAESSVKFQPLSDGYFAFYPGTDYNIVVNGTNEVIGERAESGDSPLRYSPTTTGAQVAFTKYGADYLIEFECTEAEGENPVCISEEDALQIAESLVPVRSQ